MSRAKRDRGEFRPVYAALFDGPQFQELTPAARLCLIALKCQCGAAGIKVLPGLRQALATWTGFSERACAAATQLLQDHDWICIDGSVVWVKRGLEFEPSMDASNPKQRTYLQRLVDALPSRKIVDAFRVGYAQWFEGVSDTPPDTPPDRVSDGYGIANRSTSTSTSTKTKKVRKPSDAHASGENGKRVTWLTPYLDLWHRKAGTLTAGHAAKVLAPVREEYGDADALLGMGAYLDEPRLPDKPVTVDWFAKNAARWIREGKTPLQNPDGTLTVRGERITRPGT